MLLLPLHMCLLPLHMFLMLWSTSFYFVYLLAKLLGFSYF